MYVCRHCNLTFDEPHETHTSYEAYYGVACMFPDSHSMTLYECPYCGEEGIDEIDESDEFFYALRHDINRLKTIDEIEEYVKESDNQMYIEMYDKGDRIKLCVYMDEDFDDREVTSRIFKKVNCEKIKDLIK